MVNEILEKFNEGLRAVNASLDHSSDYNTRVRENMKEAILEELRKDIKRLV